MGIGLTSPGAKLVVSGDTAIDSGFNVGTSVLYLSHNAGVGIQRKTAILAPSTGAFGRSSAMYFAMNTANDSTDVSASDAKLTILESGLVGIGTTSPDILLSVGSNSPTGSVAHFENSTGSCYINPTTTSLSCSSDARLKTNIASLASTTLDELLALNPVTYSWKREAATSSPHIGFIAQDVQRIFPDLVSQGPDGYLTMNYAGLTPYLVKAVQELVQTLDDLATRVAGFAEKFTTKELTFDRASGTDLTLSHELCINDDAGVPVCVTGTQLRSLLSGSVLRTGAQAGRAAGASGSGDDDGAPSGSSMPIGEKNMDAASSTPPLPPQQATSFPATLSPASDNQATSTAPDAAKDNALVVPVAARGTDATTTAQ